MARASKREQAADRFEVEKLDFFEKVRTTYRARAEKFPEQFRVIDAARPLEEVKAQLDHVLEQYLD